MKTIGLLLLLASPVAAHLVPRPLCVLACTEPGLGPHDALAASERLCPFTRKLRPKPACVHKLIRQCRHHSHVCDRPPPSSPSGAFL